MPASTRVDSLRVKTARIQQTGVMGKFLLLVLAVIAGWLLVKGLFKSRGAGDGKPGESVQAREK